MRTAMAVMLVTACATAALAQGVSTMKGTTPFGGTIVISAVEIEGIGSDRLVLREKARVKSFDKDGSAVFDAAADKIVVTLLTAADNAGKTVGQNVIKSAELIGSPKIVYTSVDSATGKRVTTTAVSKSATYDGVQQTATLKGSVRIESVNPALFEGPAVMTGDEAMVNLKSPLGPEEVRFRIKSAPPGVSTIQATPKPKEETDTKK